MQRNIHDLYSDDLISTFGQTTAIGLTKLMEGSISHAQGTRSIQK